MGQNIREREERRKRKKKEASNFETRRKCKKPGVFGNLTARKVKVGEMFGGFSLLCGSERGHERKQEAWFAMEEKPERERESKIKVQSFHL